MKTEALNFTEQERLDFQTYLSNRYSKFEALRMILQSRNPRKITATPRNTPAGETA